MMTSSWVFESDYAECDVCCEQNNNNNNPRKQRSKIILFVALFHGVPCPSVLVLPTCHSVKYAEFELEPHFCGDPPVHSQMH